MVARRMMSVVVRARGREQIEVPKGAHLLSVQPMSFPLGAIRLCFLAGPSDPEARVFHMIGDHELVGPRWLYRGTSGTTHVFEEPQD